MVEPFETAVDARRFIFGGNARFTLKSLRTGAHFTYKISTKKDDEQAPFFVSVLRGNPDDWQDGWTYIGFLPRLAPEEAHPQLIAGRKGKPDALSFKALAWALGNLDDEEMEVYHEGRCCRCGRTLTHPESVKHGIGPECAHQMGMS